MIIALILIAIVGAAPVAALSAISAYKEGYETGWRDGAAGVPCNPFRPHGLARP